MLALPAGQVVEVPRVLRGGVAFIRSPSGTVVGVPGSGERAAVDAGVQVRAVVNVHGLAAALLDHLPEGFLDVRDRDRLVLAEELRVESSALLLEPLNGERLARVEPDVLGVVRGGDAVGTEPIALGELIQRRGQAVHVVPARRGRGGVSKTEKKWEKRVSGWRGGSPR